MGRIGAGYIGRGRMHLTYQFVGLFFKALRLQSFDQGLKRLVNVCVLIAI